MTQTTEAPEEITLKVQGMDCGACALTIQNSVSQLQGVEDVEVSFTTESMRVVGGVSKDALEDRLESLGYKLADSNQARRIAAEVGFFGYVFGRREVLGVLAGALVLTATLPFALEGAAATLHDWGCIALVVAGGWPVARKGARTLLRGRQVTIDLLMAIAATGAIAIGETGEAAAVITLYVLGEALEGFSAERARSSLQSLLALAPTTATVLRPVHHGSGHDHDHDHDHDEHHDEHHAHDHDNGHDHAGDEPHWHASEVATAELQIGDRLLVRAGERVPVDARLLGQSATLNEAPVTGESKPVRKATGDPLLAGTVNGDNAFEAEVTAAASDSTIQRIGQLVERAQSQRAPMQRFVDRFARWYTPAVVVAAGLAIAVPPLFFGAPLLDTPEGHGWLYRGLALLIVACPCALVISTPVTIVSALTGLSRAGILIKGGAFLDALSRLRAVAFDKTGTLTSGRPALTSMRTAQCPETHAESCDDCDDLLAMASAVERGSGHPLAHAVLSEAEMRNVGQRYPTATAVEALHGRGVRGEVGGMTLTVGSHARFHESGHTNECALHEHMQDAEANGQTIMAVERDGEMVGYMAAADPLRADSARALASLKQHHPEVHTAMFTGDHGGAARAVAERASHFDEIRSGMLPEDKLDAVRELHERYGITAMVGDGVNDAPALAAADIGIAMGGAATAQAMETADVVLMGDSLEPLVGLIRTAHRTRRVLTQNIALSLVLKGAFLVLALAGLATLWAAVLADVGTTLLVTLNGMRAMRVEV